MQSKLPQGMQSGERAAPPAGGAQRPAGRGGEAALRLDKRTYLDRKPRLIGVEKEQGRYSVTLRDYGGGLAEIGWSFVPTLAPFKSGRGESEQLEDNQDRAARRARSRLRQLILASGCDHLLTLTYRENITDYRQACFDLSAFVRKVKREQSGFVYVGVPEKQQRGAWHWHLAVVGRQNVVFLRNCWRGVVGEGNIDVQPPKRTKRNRRLAIVGYLGKYLAKGFKEGHRELNGHRFRASLGIAVPAASILIPDHLRGEVKAYLIEQLRKCAGSVGHIWEDALFMAGWACSWE